MVLDPKDRPKRGTNEPTFAKVINRQLTDWKPLKTDLSVDDFDNEYLDFWMKYNTPTYIHYEDEALDRAIVGDPRVNASKGLYEIIRKAVKGAEVDHPEIFGSK
jgi:hypothetical protein